MESYFLVVSQFPFSFSFFFFFFYLAGLRFLIFSGVNVKKYGQWAVVTGATDGIGLGMEGSFHLFIWGVFA